jgi:hypothetical protein
MCWLNTTRTHFINLQVHHIRADVRLLMQAGERLSFGCIVLLPFDDLVGIPGPEISTFGQESLTQCMGDSIEGLDPLFRDTVL